MATMLAALTSVFTLGLAAAQGCADGISTGQKESAGEKAAERTSKDGIPPGDAGHHPAPPAARERVEERRRMVDTQMMRPPDGRTPIRSQAVLDAMRTVPRHVFVPVPMRRHAYEDTPLPIGHDQTISQPYIVAWMTELLELKPDSKVLEIGTGSGYQAAVLAHLTEHVYSIEIVEELAKRARRTLEEQGYRDVKCRHGDGYNGWAEHAPFDRIIVTCAPEDLPEPLWKQLAPGGRIVIPIGGVYALQRLVIVEKTAAGERRDRVVSAVRFVPLTRDAESVEKDADGKP
jgi:protein-L-isoaspartate(D-aspartate) O-methyltransferase